MLPSHERSVICWDSGGAGALLGWGRLVISRRPAHALWGGFAQPVPGPVMFASACWGVTGHRCGSFGCGMLLAHSLLCELAECHAEPGQSLQTVSATGATYVMGIGDFSTKKWYWHRVLGGLCLL